MNSYQHREFEEPVKILEDQLRMLKIKREHAQDHLDRAVSSVTRWDEEMADVNQQILIYEHALKNITTAQSPAASGDKKMEKIQ